MGKPTIWNEQNLEIVRRHYGTEPVECVHARVVEQLEEDSRAQGRPVRQYPTLGGVVWAAQQAGAISKEDLDNTYMVHRLEKRREHNHTYRARNAPGHVSNDIRARVFERDASTCQYCGQPGTQVDHLRPVVRGGTGDTWNLALACQTCNIAKGSKDLGPTLVGSMQRILQGGWKYRGEILVDRALKQIEKRARADAKGATVPKLLLEPLTGPHLWCPRCERISDSSGAMMGRLKSGRATLVCGLCRKAANLVPTRGFVDMGQKADLLDRDYPRIR